MNAEEVLTEIIRLQAEMQRVIIESTDANEWKEYYDRQIELMESYARQKAVEFAEHYNAAISSYAKSQKPTEFWYDEFNKQ